MPKLAENGYAEESVWDYPRPPVIEPCRRRVRVEHHDRLIADSTRALRVLETASPPTIYIPTSDVRTDILTPAPGRSSVCEWKGVASYVHLEYGTGIAVEHAGWGYNDPKEKYWDLVGHIAFYAGRLACHLDDERVRPQGGAFYGGWVTAEIVGPYKGEPGTEGW
jgi:uncharacterized protein (DUF427 family)